jgi:hypothetical protein
MSHVRSWDEQEVVGKDPTGGDVIMHERRPFVIVDFIIRYAADLGIDPPREIQIRWARELCLELRRRGFNVRWFSFDGFQSVDSMQILESNGIETKRVSTDLSIEPYRGLRDLFNEGRLELPIKYEADRDPLVLRELYGLNKLSSGRLDHAVGASKDLADSLACSVQGAVQLGGQEDGGIAVLGGQRFYAGEPGDTIELPIGFVPPLAASSGGFNPFEVMESWVDLTGWEDQLFGGGTDLEEEAPEFYGPGG